MGRDSRKTSRIVALRDRDWTPLAYRVSEVPPHLNKTQTGVLGGPKYNRHIEVQMKKDSSLIKIYHTHNTSEHSETRKRIQIQANTHCKALTSGGLSEFVMQFHSFPLHEANHTLT